jgi:hypothetical protein
MAGGGGEQPSTTTSVQKSDPWSGQQPYLTKGFEKAGDYLNQPAQTYYPGQTVVPFSPETNLAMQMQTARAINGSPIQGAANNQLTSTLNGDYLYGGQGFNAAMQAATNKILPQVNSTFAAAGRGNGGLASVAQTQAIADAFANQYGQERENQQRAMLFAPQVANMDYQDISQLANVGAQKESLQQEQTQDAMNRYNFNQGAPLSQLQNYMNLIQGNYGGSSTSTSSQPMYRNQGSGMLGGAMAGAQVGSMFGNPLIGAIGGGLLGAF